MFVFFIVLSYDIRSRLICKCETLYTLTMYVIVFRSLKFNIFLEEQQNVTLIIVLLVLYYILVYDLILYDIIYIALVLLR